MITRVRTLSFAVAALVLSVLAMCTIPVSEPRSMAVAGLVAASLIVAFAVLSTSMPPAPPRQGSGPPPSAQRRRRGRFLRQSNPDTAGRPRPRAPGCAAA